MTFRTRSPIGRCPGVPSALAGIFPWLLLLCGTAALPSTDWPPVDPADLALKEPRVEKDADAEAIYWEVRVLDELDGASLRAVLSHYIRIKLFTDRGRDQHATVDIPYPGHDRITDIAGRTIKPNGETLELRPDSVYERTLLKAGGMKVKAKSFAMPGLETGAIIEYRWREIRADQLTNYVRLQFQREIPIQLVKYYIKPFRDPLFPFHMRVTSYRLPNPGLRKEPNGFLSTTATNMPAFKAEPYMPAEENSRAWMLVYYSADVNLPPDKYWPAVGAQVYEGYRDRAKANDRIRSAAQAAAAGETTPEGQLRKLYDFVRAEVRNASCDPSLSEEVRDQLKENPTASDTLKLKAGGSYDVTMLYIALAKALGHDPRLVRISSQNNAFFNRDFTDLYYLGSFAVAVRLEDRWQFLDPAAPSMPFGMLPARKQGRVALIADPKAGTLVLTPTAPAGQSLSTRSGQFQLHGDGTLEGDVILEHSGHAATAWKSGYRRRTTEERREYLEEGVKSRFTRAEVTKSSVENADDSANPLRLRYHLKVPGYAEWTGKRMFVRPSFFRWTYAPRFPGSERRYPIEFDYPWSERDAVTITLPAGYALDTPSAPQSISFGETGSYMVSLKYDRTQSVLVYERSLVVGAGGSVSFPVASYPELKRLFDTIQERDDHTVMLKQAALAGP